MSKLHSKTKWVCLICADDVIIDNRIILHKSRRQTHILCRICAEKWLTMAINEKLKYAILGESVVESLPFIHCPGSFEANVKCKSIIDINNKKDCLIKHFPKLEELYMRLVLVAAEGAVECPQCKGLLIIDDNVRDITCSFCDTMWCKDCVTAEPSLAQVFLIPRAE